MKGLWITAAGLLVMASAPCTAVAQTLPRVTVSVEVGVSGNRAAGGLEEMLTRAGMDDTDPFGGGFFSAGSERVAHPYSNTDPAAGLDLRVRLRPRISVGFSRSTSNIGGTHGYYAPDPGGVRAVSFLADYSVRSLALTVNWHPASHVRLGVGPASHEVRFSPLQAPTAAKEERNVGWVAETGYAFINRKYFFSEATARYRGVGALAVDGMTVVEPFDFGAPDTLTVTLPPTTVRFHHWTVAVGFGLKFGS